MADRRLTGVLLVGGASRRFGSPKALATLDGETLAARCWRVLGEVCSERLAVGKAGDRLSLGFPIVDDDAGVRAPIAGLVAGLRNARFEVCIFLPVDCPLVTPTALVELADACLDAAVTRSGPLPGAYRRSALPVLERRLATGRLALRNALTELETCVVDVDSRLLVNVNSPDELQRIAGARAEE